MKNSMSDFFIWVFKGFYHILNVLGGVVIYKLAFTILLFLILFSVKFFNKVGRKL